VVTVSKVLDLVGIPSIFWVRGCFFEEHWDLLLDWRQPVTGFASIPARDDAAVQTVPHASKPARRHANFVAAVVAAIKVLSFASVVLLE